MNLTLLIVITVFILLLFLATKGVNLQNKENQLLKKEGVLSKYIVHHLGGHPYIGNDKPVLLAIKNNNTICFIKNLAKQEYFGKPISFNNIKDFSIKTEVELKKDITFTRLITLGVFAFAFKKKTEINNSYLTLSYFENEIEINCLFKNSIGNKQLGNLISDYSRARLESTK